MNDDELEAGPSLARGAPSESELLLLSLAAEAADEDPGLAS